MGSDIIRRRQYMFTFLFQSTLPHGERLGSPKYPHALLRFNPRSHMGSDICVGQQMHHIEFQSTLPHGERPIESDTETLVALVSIHAPTWGATLWTRGIALKNLGFQSTLPHGERHTQDSTKRPSTRFQSTLPHGERRYSGKCDFPLRSFNPRSHMGSDRVLTFK